MKWFNSKAQRSHLGGAILQSSSIYATSTRTWMSSHIRLNFCNFDLCSFIPFVLNKVFSSGWTVHNGGSSLTLHKTRPLSPAEPRSPPAARRSLRRRSAWTSGQLCPPPQQQKQCPAVRVKLKVRAQADKAAHGR